MYKDELVYPKLTNYDFQSLIDELEDIWETEMVFFDFKIKFITMDGKTINDNKHKLTDFIETQQNLITLQMIAIGDDTYNSNKTGLHFKCVLLLLFFFFSIVFFLCLHCEMRMCVFFSIKITQIRKIFLQLIFIVS